MAIVDCTLDNLLAHLAIAEVPDDVVEVPGAGLATLGSAAMERTIHPEVVAHHVFAALLGEALATPDSAAVGQTIHREVVAYPEIAAELEGALATLGSAAVGQTIHREVEGPASVEHSNLEKLRQGLASLESTRRTLVVLAQGRSFPLFADRTRSGVEDANHWLPRSHSCMLPRTLPPGIGIRLLDDDESPQLGEQLPR